jgi:bis(5'-nucleosyl)-tetraphosphatase (symmetrical)
VHREGGFLLVHAGLLPAWDEDAAARAARDVEAALRGPERPRLLAEKDRLAPGWRDDLPRWERLKLALAAFTRLRVCAADGKIDPDFDGGEDDAPAGMRPWYAWRRPGGGETILHGHWSVLGFQARPGRYALDSGCVWGGTLTAVRLDDGRVFHQPCVE